MNFTINSQRTIYHSMDESSKNELSSLVQSLSRNKEVFENLQVLQTISETCLHKIPISDIESLLFQYIFPEIKVYVNSVFEDISRIAKDAGTCESLKGFLRTSIQILKICENTVEYIKNCKKVNASDVISMPVNLSDILLATFSHCKNSNELYGEYFHILREMLMSLFKAAQNLQSMNLDIFLNNIDFQEDIDLLATVLDRMAQIGEILPELNGKAMVDQWKGYTTLVQQNSYLLQDSLDISFPLKCLITQIQSNMSTVSQMDISSEEKFRSCVNTLKACNFLLMVVMKLCESLQSNSNIPHNELLTLLITLNRYSTPFLHLIKKPPKLIECIETYVTTAASGLLGTFVKDPAFIQCYFNNVKMHVSNKESKLAFMILSISFAKKIIINDSSLESMDECIGEKWLQMVFRIIPFYHSDFMVNLVIQDVAESGYETRHSNLYEMILSHAVALAVKTSSERFKNVEALLLESILQGNFWRAVLSMDLWIIIARHGTDELTYQHVIYLAEILKSFEKQNCPIPELIFLNEITRRLFCLLTPERQNAMLQNYPWEKNLHLWNVFEWKNVQPQLHLQKLLHFILNDIPVRMSNFKAQRMTPNDWKMMCTEIATIGTLNVKVLNKSQVDQILDVLWKLWSCNNVSSSMENSLREEFTVCLSEATVEFIRCFSNIQLLQILQQIQIGVKSTKPQFQLTALHHLHQLSSKRLENGPEITRILQSISETFNSLLASGINSIVREKAFKVFADFIHVTDYETDVLKMIDGSVKFSVSKFLQKQTTTEKSMQNEEYFEMQRNLRFKHVCKQSRLMKGVANNEPQKKRARMVQDLNINILLERIKLDTDSIVDYCSFNALTAKSVSELTEVVEKLQRCAVSNFKK